MTMARDTQIRRDDLLMLLNFGYQCWCNKEFETVWIPPDGSHGMSTTGALDHCRRVHNEKARGHNKENYRMYDPNDDDIETTEKSIDDETVIEAGKGCKGKGGRRK